MKNRCSFKGCTKDAFAKGLCGSHYAQQRQGKELKPLQQQFHGLGEKERFMKRVSTNHPSGCWVWLGSRQRGGNGELFHGQWRNSSGVHELTHRASWRLLVGEIPTGALVLHHCDNPICVKPEHLYLGTQADNVRDMWDRDRAKPGVSKGEKHGCAKLTKDQVIEIRNSDENGIAIAKRFGVSPTTVYDIRNRRIWRHIK